MVLANVAATAVGIKLALILAFFVLADVLERRPRLRAVGYGIAPGLADVIERQTAVGFARIRAVGVAVAIVARRAERVYRGPAHRAIRRAAVFGLRYAEPTGAAHGDRRMLKATVLRAAAAGVRFGVALLAPELRRRTDAVGKRVRTTIWGLLGGALIRRERLADTVDGRAVVRGFKFARRSVDQEDGDKAEGEPNT